MDSFVEPAIRAQVSGPTAVEGVMQHVGVIPIVDPSILLPNGIVERGRQHVVVDTDDAQATLQQLEIVAVALAWKSRSRVLVNSLVSAR